MYSTLYGKRLDKKPDEFHFALSPSGIWENEEIGTIVNSIRDAFDNLNMKCLQILFDSADHFWKVLERSDFNIVHAGLDTEAIFSSEEFRLYTNNLENIDDKKILYYYSIKNYYNVALNMINHFVVAIGDAYATLSKPNLYKNVTLEQQKFKMGEDYRHSISPDTMRIWSGFSFSIEKIISFLDFTTKYISDLSGITPGMVSWKSKAGSVLFGDWKSIRLAKGTPLCERSIPFNIIDSLRNESVHNGTINHYSGVYEHTNDEKVNRRFILMPDYNKSTGRLLVAGGRKRFYTQDNHLNALLPTLVIRVFSDALESLNQIDAKLENRWTDMEDYIGRYPEFFAAVRASEQENSFLKYTPL
ncbi:hypothetical protein [Parasaccharibacter apium]|uniref:hypothetical protein n=1 Tax=Parasaccharibacter apium TaxID=1510841 RepID=UPI0011AF497F|nr:hypothetical protein [Parasaccharibacter apium]